MACLALVLGLLLASSACSEGIDEGALLPEGPIADFPLELVWRYSRPNPVVDVPVYHNGLLHLLTCDEISLLTLRRMCTLVALEATTGQEVWSYSAHHIGSVRVQGQRAVSNDVVGFSYKIPRGTEASTGIAALSSTSGELLWSTPVSRVLGTIAVDEEHLYYSYDLGLRALDVRSGALVWDKLHVFRGRNYATLYPVPERLYAVLDSLVVMNPQSGEVFERRRYWDDMGLTDDFFAEGILYLADTDRDLVIAEDVASGVRLWQHEYDFYTPYWTPTVSKDVLYLTHGGSTAGATNLVAVDKSSGEQLWMYETESGFPIVSEVAVLGEHAFLLASDATVRALDAGTGREVGRYQASSIRLWTEDGTGLGVAASENMLFACFGGREVLAFGIVGSRSLGPQPGRDTQ